MVQLKIYFITGNTSINTGAHKRQLELIGALNSKGKDIDVISYKRLLKKNNFIVKRHKIFKKLLNHRLAFFLDFFLESIRGKIIVKKNSKLVVFGNSSIIVVAFLKLIKNCQVILNIRSSLEEYRKSNINGLKSKMKLCIHNLIEKFSYRIADKIIVQTQIDKKYIRKKNKNILISIVPNNINPSWMQKQYFQKNNPKELKNLLFVGTLINRKGIMHLLEAMKYFKKLNLTILGDGPLKKEVNTFIKRNKLDNVTLKGFIKNPFPYYVNHDLLIIPSLRDSFPNTLLEALYCGMPAVGSDVDGISEILNHKELLFKPNSAQSIKKSLKYSKKNFDKIKNLSSKRKQNYKFDWVKKIEKEISK